jgi:hypothetical protein
MSLSTAQSLAWSLARTLMTIVVLIKTAHGYSVMTLQEYDGEAGNIVREYDPFAR